MNKHTPGPWRVEPSGHSIPGYHICNRITASTYTGRNSFDPPSDEDARLIAAAPEMLNALEKLNVLYSDMSRTSFDLVEIRSILRMSIAKAAGGAE